MNKIKKDVSVEYAHIYTNNKINEEHELSLKVLGTIKKRLQQKSQSMVFTVLIDDYSFPDETFNYEKFSLWLSARGYKPDVIFRESQLIPLCDLVIKKKQNQIKRTIS